LPHTAYTPDGDIRPDIIGKHIADRLAQDTASHVTVGQAIAAWLKTRHILHVTTSSQEFRMRQQLRVFAEGFPELTEPEMQAYEHCRFGRA
jgi:diketogulonate reductase-like aldo/keto reductase